MCIAVIRYFAYLEPGIFSYTARRATTAKTSSVTTKDLSRTKNLELDNVGAELPRRDDARTLA